MLFRSADPRSYRVSAEKILTVLKDYYKPQWNIEKGGKELMSYYESIGFDRATFDGYKCTRLKCLKKRISDGTINENLQVIS